MHLVEFDAAEELMAIDIHLCDICVYMFYGNLFGRYDQPIKTSPT